MIKDKGTIVWWIWRPVVCTDTSSQPYCSSIHLPSVSLCYSVCIKGKVEKGRMFSWPRLCSLFLRKSEFKAQKRMCILSSLLDSWFFLIFIYFTIFNRVMHFPTFPRERSESPSFHGLWWKDYFPFLPVLRFSRGRLWGEQNNCNRLRAVCLKR